jgi:endonuclease/exonuclease/phosphatase family metal-dependent hydrolase
MRFRAFLTAAFDGYAPSLLGALCCVAAPVCNFSCEKKGGTPDWELTQDQRPKTAPAETRRHSAKASPPAAIKSPESLPADLRKSPETRVDSAARASSEGLRFITYNVENWLTMDRYIDGKNLKSLSKPDGEKRAVVTILARHAPDVIGLCEIGTASDLAEIQARLKAAGLDLPHSHYTGGSDPTRHLGLLSRFPLTATAKPAESQYQLAGRTFAINRGILDATLQARGKTYRFIGAHLKSKRDSEQGDQEAIRLNEARLLRRHINTILTADADARLIVYGDFNDTRATPAIKTLTGKYNDPSYLTEIPLKDSHLEAWTYHWALHDIYSGIDFIMVSQGIRRDVDFPAAKIIDDAEWEQASDHRPGMAVFK